MTKHQGPSGYLLPMQSLTGCCRPLAPSGRSLAISGRPLRHASKDFQRSLEASREDRPESWKTGFVEHTSNRCPGPLGTFGRSVGGRAPRRWGRDVNPDRGGACPQRHKRSGVILIAIRPHTNSDSAAQRRACMVQRGPQQMRIC